MKCKFELHYNKTQQTKNGDPFGIKKQSYPNPERLSDNGILDTYIEILWINTDTNKTDKGSPDNK